MNSSQALALFIIVVAGVALPLVARRISTPAMVLEILFGVIIGQSGLKESFSGEWLYFLAHFGFLMLMFLAGLEIDFSAMRKESPQRLLIFGAMFFVTVFLSYGASRLMGYSMFLALVLSTTSLGLVLPTLRDLGLTRTPLGQSGLVSATLADFLTLLGLTAYVLYHDYGLDWRMIKPVPVFAFFAATLWAVKLWTWWNPEKALSLLGESDPSELAVRAAFALLFVFVAISEFLGLEPILGAFLGGTIIAAVFPERGLLEKKLIGFSFGFLIPIFFIYVGTQFSIESIASLDIIILTLELLIAAIVIKILPSFMLRLGGLSSKESIMVGVLLSARLSLIIAATEIGVEKNILPAHLEPSIILVALVTSSFSPIAFRKMAKKWMPESVSA